MICKCPQEVIQQLLGLTIWRNDTVSGITQSPHLRRRKIPWMELHPGRWQRCLQRLPSAAAPAISFAPRQISRYVKRWEYRMSRYVKMVKVWILGWNVLKTCRSPDRSSALDAVTSRKCFNESPKSHTIHAMVGLLCGIFYFFSLPVNLCFPYFFEKSICKRYSLEISRDFPT